MHDLRELVRLIRCEVTRFQLLGRMDRRASVFECGAQICGMPSSPCSAYVKGAETIDELAAALSVDYSDARQ